MKELIIIEWEDAYSDEVYIKEDFELEEGMMTVTVGWLVKETETLLMLAKHYFTQKDDDRLKDYLVVPKVLIKKMKRWKPKELDRYHDLSTLAKSTVD